MIDLILHIAKREEWKKGFSHGSYRSESLDAEGFIHCSTPDQVITVANSFFRGKDSLVLLYIDSQKVKPEIKFENLEEGEELFPHVYGSLNIDAVIKAVDLTPQPDGTFVLPGDNIESES